MNGSNFMDKQVMDLSRSKAINHDDFIDLMNPNPVDDGGDKIAESIPAANKETILPNYDFQPIRPAGIPSRSADSPSMGGGSGGAGVGDYRAWNSADSMSNSSHVRSYGYLGSTEPDKVLMEKAHNASDSAVVSEIDRAMKKFTDSIVHAIDGLSARLSQVESRTRQLEHSLDDLKVSLGDNHGSVDGKMRHLGNVLREVQSCMQDLKDKQDVMNARIQLEKLQMDKVDQTPETQNTSHIAPQQSKQQFPVPQQSLPGVSPNAPPPPQQMVQPPVQPPSQYPPPPPMPAVQQPDTYFPPPQEPPTQRYPHPPAQQQPPHAPPPQPGVTHQQYQPSPPTPYPRGPHPSQQHQQQAAAVNPPPGPPPQHQPPMAQHYSEEPQMPSQPYPPTLLRPPPQQTSGTLPPQQFYSGPPSHMYDSPTGRSGSGFSSSAYAPPSVPSDPYPYGGPPSHYGNNPTTKHQPNSSGGGGSYPQIPTARILPAAIPTATSVSSGGNSGGNGNRVPVDDVIDKVTNMGFPRDQVRAAVRRLTENGQAVDLNVVLDKLMNEGDGQPPGGWFRR